MNSNMNSKCGFCGAASDCIPFDGGFCEAEGEVPSLSSIELVIMEVNRVVNPDLWPARYFVRYAHDYGETIGQYNPFGRLVAQTGVMVWIPQAIIVEQMAMTVNELEALFETKAEENKWQQLPMAA